MNATVTEKKADAKKPTVDPKKGTSFWSKDHGCQYDDNDRFMVRNKYSAYSGPTDYLPACMGCCEEVEYGRKLYEANTDPKKMRIF